MKDNSIKARSSGYLSTVAVHSPKGKVGAAKKIQDSKHFWNVRRSKFACVCRHQFIIKMADHERSGVLKNVYLPVPLWMRVVSKKDKRL